MAKKVGLPDMLAALSAADFPQGALIVLTEIVLHDPSPVCLSPSDIARRWRHHRVNISRTIRQLVADRIIVKLPEDRYRLNPDYFTWRTEDGPLFDPISLALILRSPTTRTDEPCSQPATRTDEPCSQPATGCSQPATPYASDQQKWCSQSATARSQPATPVANELHPRPIRNAGARAGANSEEREENTKTPPPPPPAPRAGPAPDAAAALATTKELFGPEQAAAIGRQIDDTNARIHGRWDCFAAALREASRVSYPIGNLRGYCISRALTFIREGIPPEPVDPAPRRAREDDDPPYFEYFEITPEMRARQEAIYRQEALYRKQAER